MVNGNVWSVPAEIPTIARCSPVSSDLAVVIVISSVLVAVRFSFSAAACSLAGTIVKTTFSPGLCLVTSFATSSGAFTVVPSTALMTSPACSLPSAGVSLTTVETITQDFTGMFSSLRAATLALSWDWLNSSAFSCVDCSSVLPSG
jgi:hypothetical protein